MYTYYPTYVGAENSYRINILINGKIATKYNHDGDLYIEGRKGSQYEIELINDMMYDAEFVVSIDGLSIIDGKPAGIESTGYIVRGRSRSRIKGWLLNDKKAAAFKFGDRVESYASQSKDGDISNAGVIGLMVFARKPNYDLLYNQCFHSIHLFGNDAARGIPINTAASNSLYASGSASLRGSAETITPTSLGTEFGRETDFSTQKVSFERASNIPTVQSVLYYGDAADLNRLGIVLDWQKKPQPRPNPFPADNGYCQPPTNWRKR